VSKKTEKPAAKKTQPEARPPTLTPYQQGVAREGTISSAMLRAEVGVGPVPPPEVAGLPLKDLPQTPAGRMELAAALIAAHRKPEKWPGWNAAFDVARKSGASGSESRTARLLLAPEEFRKALTQLDHEMEGLSRGDPRHQEACRLGTLAWWDETGACVVLERA
jgi:hypothetical protein